MTEAGAGRTTGITPRKGDHPRFQVGQLVVFAGLESVVSDVAGRQDMRVYLIENGGDRLPMWIPEDVLVAHQAGGRPETEFRREGPDVVIVDEFFHDPDQVRAIALAQEYESDLRFYKGLRTKERFLWPWLREEFEELLGRDITDWLGYTANGVFQQTTHDDPLVWHHDTQEYAAAVYLTPDPPPSSGTSFWRDRTHGCRRSPDHWLEQRRLGSPEAIDGAKATVYDEHNVVNPDNWELVESVSGLYNRLVIWDAKLFHSATSYDGFASQGPAPTRLVQLFFFDAS